MPNGVPNVVLGRVGKGASERAPGMGWLRLGEGRRLGAAGAGWVKMKVVLSIII
jgi:hypothetical protein